MVEIKSVVPHSPAHKAELAAGDKLISVNGHAIRDVLDYRFYICDKTLDIAVKRGDGEVCVKIKKPEYDDIGLEFETYLMDKQESCRNKCIFCFIDQNPHGMREGVYFKDDDTRLSFLFGNYVTLTNVEDSELDRLISMHISPVNVSVQTTNPELRQRMLHNRFAGRIMEQMKHLADGGVELNAQIVLCRGINDGAELERTLRDLETLLPHLRSVSVVPVGLTKHRRGLYPLQPYDKASAGEVVDMVESLGGEFLAKHGTRLVFPSDEFYLKAERPLPDVDFYEGFPQLENGVGMLTSLVDDVDAELEWGELDTTGKDKCRHISIVTGMASFDTISRQVEKIKKIWYNIDCRVYAVRNDFYGEEVTVSGLLTGGDIISQLKGKPLGDTLIIPRCALRHEGDVFLDDVSVDTLEKELSVTVVTSGDGVDLVHKIIGE